MYLELQDMHADLRRMQQWFLQCERERCLLSPEGEDVEEGEEEGGEDERDVEQGAVEAAREDASTEGQEATK